MTLICIGNLTIISQDNGLSPRRRQAFIWTNAGILLIGPLGTKFSEILIEILRVSFKKMHLKGSSAKWRPFCLGLNVFKLSPSSLLCFMKYHVILYNISGSKGVSFFYMMLLILQQWFVANHIFFLMYILYKSFVWWILVTVSNRPKYFSVLFQTWHWKGKKNITWTSDDPVHWWICVVRPQWVKNCIARTWTLIFIAWGSRCLGWKPAAINHALYWMVVLQPVRSYPIVVTLNSLGFNSLWPGDAIWHHMK